MSGSGDFQLLYPDSVVSSRPIAEFRGRKPKVQYPLEESTPGHAFVFLGRELDNGATVFYGAAGFYPKDNTLKSVLGEPGETNYKIPDMFMDNSFRVKISEDQEIQVKYIINNWDQTKYDIRYRSCIELVQDVADGLGLKYISSEPIIFPHTLVQHLSAMNDGDTSLRHATKEAIRFGKLRSAASAEMRGVIQRQREFWERIHDAQQEQQFSDSVRVYSGTGGSTPGFGVPFGGASGGDFGADAPMTMTYPAWPWPEPR